MKTILRDFSTAFLLGFALPCFLLSIAVRHQQQNTDWTVREAACTEPEKVSAGNIAWLQQGDAVAAVDLDTYLVGVLLAEMPVSFEQEALKAQAVASRTYARKAYETGGKHGDGSVCTDSSCCQAYLAPDAYLQMGGTEEGIEKVTAAVQDTAGLVLNYGEELIEATYFSCSGGQTEAAMEVWGTEYPYLQSVPSPGEEAAAHYEDTVFVTPEEFASLLDIHTEEAPASWIKLVEYTQAGTVRKLVVADRVFTGTQLRMLLNLPSAAIELELTETGFRITTRGYGHRVGMSQYGAEAMAASGSTFQQILSHYYPGTELDKLEPDEQILYNPRKE